MCMLWPFHNITYCCHDDLCKGIGPKVFVLTLCTCMHANCITLPEWPLHLQNPSYRWVCREMVGKLWPVCLKQWSCQITQEQKNENTALQSTYLACTLHLHRYNIDIDMYACICITHTSRHGWWVGLRCMANKIHHAFRLVSCTNKPT